MRSLYPEIAADAEHWLDVGAGHQIRYELSGSPDGIPVVFLHGGPGSGCKPEHRRYFDPARYRICLMDQRGTGQSRPFGRLEGNDTGSLLADVEAVRETLGIERWVVFGGSWGGTLALLYAETYPERVLGLVLRGIFLARSRDLEWYIGIGLKRIFPDVWEAFEAAIPPGVEPMIDRAANAVLDGETETARAMARAWERLTGEAVFYSLAEPLVGATPSDADAATLDRLVTKTAIEMHYARHRYFIRENQILDDIGRVPRVPTEIVHGRRDITCLPETGWAVHRALPGSTMSLVHAAGHLAGEPGNVDALVRATDRIAGAIGG